VGHERVRLLAPQPERAVHRGCAAEQPAGVVRDAPLAVDVDHRVAGARVGVAQVGEHDAAVGGGVEQRVRDARAHRHVAFDGELVRGEPIEGLQAQAVGHELQVERPLAVDRPAERDPAPAVVAAHAEVVEREHAAVHVAVALADGELLAVQLRVRELQVGLAVHVEQRAVEPQVAPELALQPVEVDEHVDHVLDAAPVDLDGGLHRHRRAEVDGVPAVVRGAPELGARVLERDGLEARGPQLRREVVGVLDAEDLEVAHVSPAVEHELVERADDAALDVALALQAHAAQGNEVLEVRLGEVELEIERTLGPEPDVDPGRAAVARAAHGVGVEEDVVLLEGEATGGVGARQIEQVLRPAGLERPVTDVELRHAEREVPLDQERLEGAGARDLDVAVEVDPRRGRGVELLQQRQQAHVLGDDVGVDELELAGHVPPGHEPPVGPRQHELLHVDAVFGEERGGADLAEVVGEERGRQPGDVEPHALAEQGEGSDRIVGGSLRVEVEVDRAVGGPRGGERGGHLLEVGREREVDVELVGQAEPEPPGDVDGAQIELDLGHVDDVGPEHEVAEEQLGGLFEPADLVRQRPVEAGGAVGCGVGVEPVERHVPVGELEARGAVDDADAGEREAPEGLGVGLLGREVAELPELALLVEVERHDGPLEHELPDADAPAPEDHGGPHPLGRQDGLAVVHPEHVQAGDLGAGRPEPHVDVGEGDGLAELLLEHGLDELDGPLVEVLGAQPTHDERDEHDDGERPEPEPPHERPPQAPAPLGAPGAAALPGRGGGRGRGVGGPGGGGSGRGLGHRSPWGTAYPPAPVGVRRPPGPSLGRPLTTTIRRQRDFFLPLPDLPAPSGMARSSTTSIFAFMTSGVAISTSKPSIQRSASSGSSTDRSS
jgi:hypothetical protein